MGRGKVPNHLKRIKCPLHNVMLPAWVYDEHSRVASAKGIYIKDAIEQALTRSAMASKKARG